MFKKPAAMFVLLASMNFGLLGSMLYVVEAGGVSTNSTVALDEVGFAQTLADRTIGRVEVEDFDYIISKSMLETPNYFFLGKGLGQSHVDTDHLIPERMRYYTEGKILSPKSGSLFLLANAGVLGSICFILFIVNYITQSSMRRRADDAYLRKFVDRSSYLLAFLLCVAFLRFYVFEYIFLLIAVAKYSPVLSDKRAPLLRRRLRERLSGMSGSLVR